MASSGRYGSVGTGGNVLSVRFNANSVIRLNDALTGYFIGGTFQRQVEAANRQMAERIQQAQADSLDKSMEAHTPHRPQRPGHRLDRKSVV